MTAKLYCHWLGYVHVFVFYDGRVGGGLVGWGGVGGGRSRVG